MSPTLLMRDNQPHPLTSLQLARWRLSANVMKQQTFSESTRNILLAAWRKNTSSAYSSAWNKWVSWCDRRKVNPLSAPLSAILEFLKDQFEEGKAYRTLNVYRSIAINASYIRAASRFRKCPVNEVECGLLRFRLFLNGPSTECDHALFQKLNE